MSDLGDVLDRTLGFLGERLVHFEPLGPRSTYRTGGAAERFVVIDNEAELQRVAIALAGLRADSRVDRHVLDQDVLDRHVHVIGKGSNLLVADRGVDGLVIQLGDSFAGLAVIGSHLAHEPGARVEVDLGASLAMPVAARRMAKLGLTGFEWAVGIPGSVGGAVRMNAGGHGSDLADVLVGVRVVDLARGETLEMQAPDLRLEYRHSALADHQIVTSARVASRVGDPATSAGKLSDIVQWRRDNQPGGANAGSVFTNPPGDSAGRLIDAAGCRGLRVGTAEVSQKHANFIQADPNGSADDIAELMLEVLGRVRDHHGIVLRAETVMLGFDGSIVSTLKGTNRPQESPT